MFATGSAVAEVCVESLHDYWVFTVFYWRRIAAGNRCNQRSPSDWWLLHLFNFIGFTCKTRWPRAFVFLSFFCFSALWLAIRAGCVPPLASHFFFFFFFFGRLWQSCQNFCKPAAAHLGGNKLKSVFNLYWLSWPVSLWEEVTWSLVINVVTAAPGSLSTWG